jgi:aldehyde dehydrogenase (NAD+)
MDGPRLASLIESMRDAQEAWRRVPLQRRAAIIGKLPDLIASNAPRLHAAICYPQRQSYRETLSAELLPLAAAARWHADRGYLSLRPRTAARLGKPRWLGSLRSVVVREPLGMVMIIGAGNYPISLTGIQSLQALLAGNGVIVKPAPGAEAASGLLGDLYVEAGIPPPLIQSIDASVESAQQLIAAGIDQLVMTGSSSSGRAVLAALAPTLTPAIMELSGCDAVFLLPEGEARDFVAELLFGLRLNGGATCLAPRRAFIPQSRIGEIEGLLASRLSEVGPTPLAPAIAERILEAVRSWPVKWLRPSPMPPSAADLGWDGYVRQGYPVILCDVPADFPLAAQDLFAPLAMLCPYPNLEEAIRQHHRCRYGLTASIFGDPTEAQRVAERLRVGVVVINDMIVPTADPELPFGGVGESGFGVTRGIEGLLAMTHPKVIIEQRGWIKWHLRPPMAADEGILEGLLEFQYRKPWPARWAGFRKLIRHAVAGNKQT